jgi:hypothetical protein
LPEVCPATLCSFPRLRWWLPDTPKVQPVQGPTPSSGTHGCKPERRPVTSRFPGYASSRGERFHESNTSLSRNRTVVRVE